MIDNHLNYSLNNSKSRVALERFQPVSFQSSNKNNKKSFFHNSKTKNTYNEEEKADNLGKRLVKIVALTTLCVFIGFKGAPKKLRSKLDQAHKNIIDVQFGEGGKKGIMFFLREGLRKTTACSKAIFNLAPLKDVLVAKAMQKNKYTKKIAENITNLFEKISFITLRHSYSKTNEKLEVLFADFDEINSKINSKIPKDQVAIINSRIARIRKVFSEGFNETSNRKRLAEIKNEFDGYDRKRSRKVDDNLMNRVWSETYHDLKKFMKETAYTSFISEKLALDTKIRNTQKINDIKLIISNSLTNMCEDCFDLLIHIDAFIEPGDKAARDIIKRIANKLKKYKVVIKTTNGDGHEVLQDGTIKANLVQLKSVFKRSKYKTSTVEGVSDEIDKLINRIDHHKRGELNEILCIYKKYLPIEEFMQVLKKTYKTADVLEKSVDLETDKMFDKVRDLKIGSAPKDVLALSIPLGMVGYGLSKADTTDEKVSVTIKYGIPIIGAIVITMYCTIGLVAAGPSLLIGLLSGLAINQVGDGVDNIIKRQRAKKTEQD